MAYMRIDVRRILCPVDFSDCSARALEHAARLAAFFEATLHVVHVAPTLVDWLDPFLPAPGTSPDTTRAKVEEGLARLTEPIAEWNVRIERTVRTGSPAREIERMAAELPADLVVMGTHGRTGLPRFVLGSVTETVMHRVTCPVLAVGHEAGQTSAPPFRRILCPTDLRPGSERTLDFALALAAENDAEIEVLRVVETIALDRDAGHALDGPEESRGTRRRLLAEADAELRAAIPPGLGRWCTVRRRVAAGEPARTIVEAARSARSEVVVMGTHSTSIDRALLGSTTHAVIREAPCAVLVVHEPRDHSSWTQRGELATTGLAGAR